MVSNNGLEGPILGPEYPIVSSDTLRGYTVDQREDMPHWFIEEDFQRPQSPPQPEVKQKLPS
jgi:hypothetical protein